MKENLLLKKYLIDKGVFNGSRNFKFLLFAIDYRARNPFCTVSEIYNAITLEYGVTYGRVSAGLSRALKSFKDKYVTKYRKYNNLGVIDMLMIDYEVSKETE